LHSNRVPWRGASVKRRIFCGILRVRARVSGLPAGSAPEPRRGAERRYRPAAPDAERSPPAHAIARAAR